MKDFGPKKLVRIDNEIVKKTYQFDRFELDMARFELREDGAVHSLEPQVFAVLAYLIEHRERLVPRNELFEELWVGRVVTDSALTSRIKSARQVLGDSGKAQQFIKTIHGKGFRFVADVRFAHSTRIGTRGRFTSESSGQSPYFLHVCACCGV